MPKLEFTQPMSAPPIPFWERMRCPARILLYRSIPIKCSLKLSCFLRRLEMWTHPARREKIAGLLKPLMPSDVTTRALREKVILSRAIRQLGGHTYAPVFRRSRQWLLRTFQPRGLEVLEAIRSEGRGAIILGTHAGMNAWVAPVLTQLGYPVRFMQRKHVSPEKLLLLRLSGWVNQGLPYPELGEEGIHLKLLCDLIRQGEWIQHVADYPDDMNGVRGKLLGREVRYCRAPWVLARLTGAPLIPVLVLVGRQMQPRLDIGPPIFVPARPDSDAAIHSAMQTYLDFVGSRVKDTPWQFSLSRRQTTFGA